MLVQISQNLQSSKLISRCYTLPFIFDCFHDEKHTQCR